VGVDELTLRAMAAGVHVILVDPPPHAEDLVRERLQELERKWSRFLPESDTTRLNMAPEAWTSVSRETLVLLSAMKQAWRLTAHRYDPTLLAPLLDAGYTRSIDGSGRTSAMAGRDASKTTSLDEVLVDPAASAVRLPLGIGLDPGGIGKGLAADLLVRDLLDEGCGGALVGIGGDLAMAGTPPSADDWYVEIDDPFSPGRTLRTLAVDAGGVATSSTLTRTWVHEGRRRHHVLDPGTRTSASTDLAAVTVVAATGWEAEAHATAALLSGSDAVLAYLEAHELPGVAVALTGAVMATAGLRPQDIDLRSAS
jgi:FAD:protein FMN transferase